MKRLLVVSVREDLPVRDLAHQQLNNDEQFLDSDSETGGSHFRALPEALNETGLSLGVLKLYSLDLSDVVQVPGILVVRALLWEGRLGNKTAGLLIEVLLQVAADDDVHGSGLTNLIMAQTR
jgi:hypothetical protein